MDENLRKLLENSPIIFTGLIATEDEPRTHWGAARSGGEGPCITLLIQIGDVLRGPRLPPVTKLKYCFEGVRMGLKGRAVGPPPLKGRQVFFAKRVDSGELVAFNDVLRSSYPMVCGKARGRDRVRDVSSSVFDLMLGLGAECDLRLMSDENYTRDTVAAAVWVLGEHRAIQKLEAAFRHSGPPAAAEACLAGAEVTLGLWGCLDQLQNSNQVSLNTKQRAERALSEKLRLLDEIRHWLDRDPELWIQDRLTRSSRGSAGEVLDALTQVPDDGIKRKAAKLLIEGEMRAPKR